ncbi:VIT family protein [Flavobacterium johnsoniae]|uniref:VIT1/CCC1 transporter family protein n=1 Tax=Flavobacterium TaxID=237 RepID=UPI0025B263B5|nr:VIT family protein [Flavobacterium johnsoniae]WJS93340.1 VIT family protein [Flavobacterium johnsoniae]
MHVENHFINRSGWLRAAVLGANDGILSTTSLAIGVAAASVSREPILLASVAGLVAGALSMAAGEYVSVSSQSDIETADLKREKLALETQPEEELKELTDIYIQRGLNKELARQVAVELTAHDALGTHSRDELGINEITQANPLMAAFASAISFTIGGLLPLLVAIFAPIKQMVFYQYGFSIVFLAFSGFLAAQAGGSKIFTAVLRICIWGTFAMVMSALVGYIFGVQTS